MTFGFLLLSLGVLILLAQFMKMRVLALFLMFWPLLLAAYGLFRLITDKGSSRTSAVMIVAGLLLQAMKLHWIQGNLVMILLGAALIVLGLRSVIRSMRPRPTTRNSAWFGQWSSRPSAGDDGDAARADGSGYAGFAANDGRDADGASGNGTFRGSDHTSPFGAGRSAGDASGEGTFRGENVTGKEAGQRPSGEYVDRDYLDDRFLFTHAARTYRSDSFSGGNLDVLFSSVYLDLRHVSPLESELHMNCSVAFASVTIDVPEDWHVIVDGTHYYSDVEVRSGQAPSTTLYVDCDNVAGRVKIV